MTLTIPKAIVFATLKHEGQRRKGSDVPYIVHPMEAMQILTDLDCAEDIIIAGILHDTLEDTKTTPDEIAAEFGDHVCQIVRGETEDKSKTWIERKNATISHLKSSNAEIRLVCLADKISNLRSMLRDQQQIGEQLWQRFKGSKEGIHWYYNQLLAVLQETDVDGYSNTLKFRQYIDEYKELMERVFL